MGRGEALDEMVKVAGSLYGAEPKEVGKALVENLRGGMTKGNYNVPASSLT